MGSGVSCFSLRQEEGIIRMSKKKLTKNAKKAGAQEGGDRVPNR